MADVVVNLRDAEAVIAVKWANCDANTLASGGADGRVYLWDVRQAKSCLRYLDYRYFLELRNISKQ